MKFCLKIHEKSMKYTKKRQKQSNKTIPKSIWKLPRDKKSKDEATNATKGVQNFKKKLQRGGRGSLADEKTIGDRGLGGVEEG